MVEEDVDDGVGEALVAGEAVDGPLDNGVVVGERVDLLVEPDSLGEVAGGGLFFGAGHEVGGDVADPDQRTIWGENGVGEEVHWSAVRYAGGMMIDPVIVDVPARRVVGMVVISGMEPNLCPTAWDAFVPRIQEVAIEGDCLGVVRWDYPGLAEGKFAYMACFESSMEAPEGMEAWELPAGRYARVEISELESIRPTIGVFQETWLPQSGLSAGSGPYLELYPETFPESPEMSLLFSIAD